MYTCDFSSINNANFQRSWVTHIDFTFFITKLSFLKFLKIDVVEIVMRFDSHNMDRFLASWYLGFEINNSKEN